MGFQNQEPKVYSGFRTMESDMNVRKGAFSSTGSSDTESSSHSCLDLPLQRLPVPTAIAFT